MSRICVSRELDTFRLWKIQRGLEIATNLHQSLFAITRFAFARTDGTSPETDSVEALAHVNNNSLDFVVLFILESFANSSKHDVQPHGIDVDSFLVLVLESPFSAVLIGSVFPFRTNTVFEEVVVGFLSEL
jgi:hypothetical protein